MKDGVGRGQLQWNPHHPQERLGGGGGQLQRNPWWKMEGGGEEGGTVEPQMKDGWGGGGVCYTGTPNESLGGGGGEVSYSGPLPPVGGWVLTVESLMKDHQDETTPVLGLLLPWCHLNMTNKSVKFDILMPFLHTYTWWRDFHQKAQVVGP